MPKVLELFLKVITFTSFWLLVDKKILWINVVEARNGSADSYKDDFATYEIARDAYVDAVSRYDRLNSKLFFAAQLQGIVLMGLALHSIVNQADANSCRIYFIIALAFEILSIFITVYALSIKSMLSFDYSKFKANISFSAEEQDEFNIVISTLQDRSDFLADLYKIITTYFFIAVVATFLDLIPFQFFKNEGGFLFCIVIIGWISFLIIKGTYFVDLRDHIKNDDIDE